MGNRARSPGRVPPHISPGQGAKNTSGWPAGLSAWEPTRGRTWGLGSCPPNIPTLICIFLSFVTCPFEQGK